MIRKLEILFDSEVRPMLLQHGGGVDIVDYDNNILFLKLQGGCQGCSSAKATLQDGIYKIVKKHFPDLEDIIDVTDHQSGDNPYM